MIKSPRTEMEHDQDGAAWHHAGGPGFELHRDAWGRLVLIDAEGRRHVGVDPVRSFPISEPDCWISICDADGREIEFIPAIADMPAPVRQILENELAQREFVPVIVRIVRVSSDISPSHWQVETDRGTTQFTLNSDDDVRRLGPHRALMIDTEGIRYLIPDTRSLDMASRRILERYL
jgi:Domain of unknown function (DUF1854)